MKRRKIFVLVPVEVEVYMEENDETLERVGSIRSPSVKEIESSINIGLTMLPEQVSDVMKLMEVMKIL